MKKLFCLFLITLIALISCNRVSAKLMPKTSKEVLTQRQTEYYDTDTKSVMNAVVATLYDNDYIIEDYDETLGFIRAKKTLKAAYTNKKRVAGWSVALAAATAYTVFSYGSTAATMYSPSRRIAAELKDKTVVIDANVYINKIGENKTEVRFLPVEKVLQNADGFAFNQMAPLKVIRIYKAYPYKEFFSQVENNLQNINSLI